MTYAVLDLLGAIETHAAMLDCDLSPSLSPSSLPRCLCHHGLARHICRSLPTELTHGRRPSVSGPMYDIKMVHHFAQSIGTSNIVHRLGLS